MSAEVYQPLRILPSALAETQGDLSFVAIVRSREELCRWLRDPLPGLKWLQVEGMLGDSDTWTEVAHSNSSVSLDLILSDPIFRVLGSLQIGGCLHRPRLPGDDTGSARFA